MEAYTNMTITMETKEHAIKAVEIIENIAADRTPEFETELTTFIEDIEIKENVIEVDSSCSLMSSTFCEMLPQIMRTIGHYNFGKIKMDAYFFSCNCGYEASCTGRRFRNGNIRVSLTESE